MGSWGTALFSDDLAADVRADWRDAIIDGEEPEDVTQRLIDRYIRGRSDSGDTLVFWLALAAAQLETGRLDADVRDRALTIIDSGGDVARWRETGESLGRQRQKVLDRLAQKLRGPQPKPKRLRRSTPLGVSFDVGDAVLLRSINATGDVIAVVVCHHPGYPRGVVNPVVELVTWEQDRTPTASELAQLPCVLTEVAERRPDRAGVRPHMFVVTTATKKDRFGAHIGQVIARGVPRRPAGDPGNGAAIGGEVLTSWTTWPGLIHIIGWDRFRRDVELTRSERA
ncbi:MAG TPA: hypothetical protein VMV16_02800 [Solirubrobacteraceae bacterium]|nr:hypothetical protein [Solirubrobacteraceae bacterium]